MVLGGRTCSLTTLPSVNARSPLKQQSPRISAGAMFCMVAPDERYISGRPGFPGVWIMVENSAYPN